MLPDKTTPPQAELDLPNGRARIPANWPLTMVTYLGVSACVHALYFLHTSLPFLNAHTRRPEHIFSKIWVISKSLYKQKCHSLSPLSIQHPSKIQHVG